jgi:hypothetical protein
MNYRYLGDKFTDPALKGQTCRAIRAIDGKCIRGKNGNMLVSFDGKPVVVIARLLRKIKSL